MKRRTKIVITGLVVGTAAAGIGTALAAGGDSETPITGPDLERASRSALDQTGGGRVTETEVGDEEGYYEVEVTLDDGSEVDVHLDSNFNFVGQESEQGDRE